MSFGSASIRIGAYQKQAASLVSYTDWWDSSLKGTKLIIETIS